MALLVLGQVKAVGTGAGVGTGAPTGMGVGTVADNGSHILFVNLQNTSGHIFCFVMLEHGKFPGTKHTLFKN